MEILTALSTAINPWVGFFIGMTFAAGALIWCAKQA